MFLKTGKEDGTFFCKADKYNFVWRACRRRFDIFVDIRRREDPIGIFMAEMNQFEWRAAVQVPKQSNKFAVCHSQLYFTAMSYQRNTGH